MTIKRSECLIIIPAYNSEKTIDGVLERIPNYNILVVDDGSTDKTNSIIRSKNIPHVTLKKNHGVGYALRCGFKYAENNGFKYAVTIDSDGQHDPLLIDRFLEKINQGVVVIGNRFTDLRKIPHQKLCSNYFGQLFFKKFTGFNVHDISCGFRGYEISSILQETKEDGYGFIFESLLKLLYAGYEVEYVDIPVIYQYDELLITRSVEIQGFLEGLVQNQIVNTEIVDFLRKLKNRENLSIEIEGHRFFCFYLKSYDSYIVQADFDRIRLKAKETDIRRMSSICTGNHAKAESLVL